MTFRPTHPKTLLVFSALFTAAPSAPLHASQDAFLTSDESTDEDDLKRRMGCPPDECLHDYLTQAYLSTLSDREKEILDRENNKMREVIKEHQAWVGSILAIVRWEPSDEITKRDKG